MRECECFREREREFETEKEREREKERKREREPSLIAGHLERGPCHKCNYTQPPLAVIYTAY